MESLNNHQEKKGNKLFWKWLNLTMGVIIVAVIISYFATGDKSQKKKIRLANQQVDDKIANNENGTGLPDEVKQSIDNQAKSSQNYSNPAFNTKKKPPQLYIPDQVIPKKGYIPLTFKELSGYNYQMTQQIPYALKKKYNEQDVALVGFMMPGNKNEFMLLKNQAFCCYGGKLEENDWVHVTMKSEKGYIFYNDSPVTVYGRIHLGEKKTSDGTLISLYQLKAIDIAAPKGAEGIDLSEQFKNQQ